jgi:Rod binding domain-containing protein
MNVGKIGSNQAELGSAQRKPDDPARIQDAAKQFESLLIAQLLKGARSADGGWMGTGSDQSTSTALDVAEEHFAQALSASGGLGLAAMVTKGLEQGN